MTYFLEGKVIKGVGYGREIGFPTLNLSRKNIKKVPAFGVYSGVVTLNKKVYRAGIIIGPLDNNGLPKVEAHLIGYKGNAYGRVAIIEIGKFIRKFKKFKNEKELITQIEKDLKKC